MLNPELQQAVSTAVGVGRPDELCLVQCSSTGATGAIIFHGWACGEPHARVVVKTPRDVRLNHALRHEWDEVTGLRADSRLAAIVPAALARFELHGAEYFAYQGAPGQTMYSRFRNRIFASRGKMFARFTAQALDLIVRVHETATHPVSPHAVARDLLIDLAWLERAIPDLPRAVSDCGRAFAQRLAAERRHLPSGRVHGDFSPYNVLTNSMTRDADARLIDWEHSEPNRPQHLDVFRFVGACVLLGLRGQARVRAFRQMPGRAAGLLPSLLLPWLQRLGHAGGEAWLRPDLLEALWWHYWVHAARREQERRARPDDLRGSTYLPGLVALAEEASSPERCRSGAFAC